MDTTRLNSNATYDENVSELLQGSWLSPLPLMLRKRLFRIRAMLWEQARTPGLTWSWKARIMHRKPMTVPESGSPWAQADGAIVSFLGNPILSTNTAASKKGALYIQPAAKHGDKVTYQMQFAKAGTYYMYMRFTMFESGTGDTHYLNEDSFFLPPDFGKDPQTDWPLSDAGGQNGGYTEGCCDAAGFLYIPEKGGGDVRLTIRENKIIGEGKFHWTDLISSQFLNPDTQGEPRVRHKFVVTDSQVGKPLTWTISNREPGAAIRTFGCLAPIPTRWHEYSQEKSSTGSCSNRPGQHSN